MATRDDDTATRDDVIQIARSLPDHSSAPHFDRLALKAGGKIFATVDSAGETVNLMLTPEDQSELLAVTDAARPVPGVWGRKGSTTVTLSRVERADLREWLATAWRRRATPKLLREHPDV
jgi:hypothetical protein